MNNLGAPIFVRKYPSQKRCDKCGKAFKQLYEPVVIGPFTYKFHSSKEVIEAQENYNTNIANGIKPTSVSPLTEDVLDDTFETEDNI